MGTSAHSWVRQVGRSFAQRGRVVREGDSVEPETFDMNDPATALARAGIIWRTRAMLKRRYLLAERAAPGVAAIVSMLQGVGSPVQCTPEQQLAFENNLFWVVAECFCFPDPVPTTIVTRGQLREMMLEGIRYDTDHSPARDPKLRRTQRWSVRRYIRTAWNFEYGRVGTQTTIGPLTSESAHRTVFRVLNQFTLCYMELIQELEANPNDGPAIRRLFLEAWKGESIIDHLRQALDRLRSEYQSLIERFNQASDEAIGAKAHVLVDHEAYLTPRRLAESFGVPLEALRSRLNRWRRSNMSDGWMQAADPKRGEARILYRVGSVRPVIDELVRATTKRPAQKI